jgi:hypothetical protein
MRGTTATIDTTAAKDTAAGVAVGISGNNSNASA